MPSPTDDTYLLIPPEDAPDPEVTILVPALNEEITIGRFVEWCRQGIAASGARVEILIVDSSTDRTAEIAQAGGARFRTRCAAAGGRHRRGRARLLLRR